MRHVMRNAVGLAVGPDGALYISGDKAGMVYRIRYAGS